MPDINSPKKQIEENQTLLLVDGSNYLYRAFYAIKELSNSKGFPTNAIYGFTKMLLRLLKEFQPQYIAISFDLRGPTFRNEIYDAYKATRKATPEDLIKQIPAIKAMVEAFGIKICEQQGVEADDIIGTLAKSYAQTGGKRVVIVSGDKDLMQLVDDNIVLVDTMKEVRYDKNKVKEFLGVEPCFVADFLALMGDTSDNIPGVPGIGKKGAQALIDEFGSVENIIEKIDKIKNARAKEALKQNLEALHLSKNLATIRTDIAFGTNLNWDDYRRRDYDYYKVSILLQEYEFASLLQDVRKGRVESETNYCLVSNHEAVAMLAQKITRTKSCAIEVVSQLGGDSSLLGLAIAIADGEVYFLPCVSDTDLCSRDNLEITNLLADENIAKCGCNAKESIVALHRAGITLKGINFDVAVAAYLLNPSKRIYDTSSIALGYLGIVVATPEPKSDAFSSDKIISAACGKALAYLKLQDALRLKLEQDELWELFNNIEMPLVRLLAQIELHGVLVDVAMLGEMSKELAHLLSVSEEKIYHLAGEHFNINSPKQLQEILFDKLHLPRGKKTKAGYSTDVEVLSFLAQQYELPADILAYRSITKLKSTYIDALPVLMNKNTGRIHTSYNQVGVATGRLSSNNPNLQNIPIRTVEGRRIRRSFIAPAGMLLCCADYSQIELRVLAHLSSDKVLLDAFRDGMDIHTHTAAEIFSIFPEMVTDNMRRLAKAINFGIIYGMSAFGLAKELGVDQKTAQHYIDNYFKKYSGVRAYLDATLSHAKQTGFVTTIFKRRRYLPELNDTNMHTRQFAERMAINTPVQGSAADIIKAAMLNIQHRLGKESLQTAMIMQVHDELVFELPETERAMLAQLVKEEMEGVVTLAIPLTVNISFGKNWDEAH